MKGLKYVCLNWKEWNELCYHYSIFCLFSDEQDLRCLTLKYPYKEFAVEISS